MDTIILVIHLVIVIAMVGLILIQKTGSDGLSGLGGGGSSGGNALFSVRGKSNFLTKATGILATAFLVTSLILAYLASNRSGYSLADQINPEQSITDNVKKGKVDSKAVKDIEKSSEPTPQVPLAQ